MINTNLDTNLDTVKRPVKNSPRRLVASCEYDCDPTARLREKIEKIRIVANPDCDHGPQTRILKTVVVNYSFQLRL